MNIPWKAQIGKEDNPGYKQFKHYYVYVGIVQGGSSLVLFFSWGMGIITLNVCECERCPSPGGHQWTLCFGGGLFRKEF